MQLQPSRNSNTARGNAVLDQAELMADWRLARGPPGDDLVTVAAAGVAGTLWRTPAGTGAEQTPDRIKIAGLEGGPDSSGERGRLFLGAGIIWHEDLPRSA